jgi:carboxypeptidase Q
MSLLQIRFVALATSLSLLATPALAQRAPAEPVSQLTAALLGDTPLLRDLQALTDRIGGRATGSPANARGVEWALARFAEAGVTARREGFTMPSRWLERSASAVVSGDGVRFSPRVAAMPFSVATPAAGVTAPLVDLAFGTEADFTRVGGRARGAFLLVEQKELVDVDGLFREYEEAAGIESRARAAGATGVVYMGSRPNNVLYRHNVAIGARNTMPMLVMDTDGARRALRLIRAGTSLSLTAMLDLDIGGPYESWNVVAEIPGTTRANEIVLVGSHFDSWDLGDGALDNGANAVMLIDIARQIVRLGLRPARTIRFALWNGEEQGMEGSNGYVRSHAGELGRHVMTTSFDIGCGRISGFFTNGRADLLAPTAQALAPVGGLGPFVQINAPIVGTDNFDFMLQGVPNLVANQEPASYGPNYHARSDTYDKCDPQQLRLNATIAAALAWGFATMPTALGRDDAATVAALMKNTDLPKQMQTFGLWDAWTSGARGRLP